MGLKIWRNFTQTFLKGVLLLLPLFISFYFLIWLANGIDSLFKEAFRSFYTNVEIPFGIGLVLGISIIFMVGLSSEFFIAQFISDLVEKVVKKIPVIGSIFKSLKSLADYVTPSNSKARGKTVIVTLPGQNLRMVGFLMRSDLSKLPQAMQSADTVAVYLPFSYMVGGMTLFVKSENIQEVNMSFEQAMQNIITGWVQSEDKRS